MLQVRVFIAPASSGNGSKHGHGVYNSLTYALCINVGMHDVMYFKTSGA